MTPKHATCPNCKMVDFSLWQKVKAGIWRGTSCPPCRARVRLRRPRAWWVPALFYWEPVIFVLVVLGVLFSILWVLFSLLLVGVLGQLCWSFFARLETLPARIKPILKRHPHV